MKLITILLSALVLVTSTVSSAESFQNPNFNLGKGTGFNTIIGGSDVIATDPIASTTALIVGITKTKNDAGEDEEGQYICTGSIIASDIILTAAHCVVSGAKLITIFVRDINAPDFKLDPTLARGVVAAVRHPEYSELADGDNHDIAVIRLRSAVPADFRVAEMMPASQSIKKGQSVVLAGYGVTDGVSGDGSGTLRKVTTSALGYFNDNEVILDMSKGKGACSGDSGGPAYIQVGGKTLLWGVTSRGDQTCSRFGVYTDATKYADWIAKASADLRK